MCPTSDPTAMIIVIIMMCNHGMNKLIYSNIVIIMMQNYMYEQVDMLSKNQTLHVS